MSRVDARQRTRPQKSCKTRSSSERTRSTRCWSCFRTCTGGWSASASWRRFFLEESDDPRLRLPARVRHGHGSGAGLSVHELGEGLRRLPARARLQRRCASRRGWTRRRWCSATSTKKSATSSCRTRRAASCASSSRARRSAGYAAMGASELELYVFKDSYEDVAKKSFVNLEPIGRLIEDYHIFQGTKEEFLIGAIRRHLERSGVPVESSKGEWGPGQQEIGLRYADLLEMADRHAIYKHAAKEIAWQQRQRRHVHGQVGRALRRLELPHPREPLERGRQAALQGRRVASARSTARRSSAGSSAAGWRTSASSSRSMRRTRRRTNATSPGSFAPTGIAWSYDNRTAGFRIVGHGSSLRIECRTAGADANPYLAFAATLAAGLDGIENKIEPPQAFEGDVYGALEPAAGPALAERGDRGAREEHVRARGVRRGRRSSTTCTSSAPSSGSSTRWSRTGSGSGTSNRRELNSSRAAALARQLPRSSQRAAPHSSRA